MSINELRPFIRQLAQTAEEHAYAWMLDNDPSPRELTSDIPVMLAAYRQSAALMAAEWYDKQNPNSSYQSFSVDDMADEQIENLATWVHKGPQSPENRLRLVANTLVFDAARETIWQNAQEEGVAVVRYEYADSCHGCVARATTEPTAHNSRSAELNRRFHPSCEGMLVPVRTGIWEPPSHAREWHPRLLAARRAGNANPDDIAKWLSSN